MAQYAITFDMDTTAMRAAGLTQAQRVTVYLPEIREALAQCGFTAHPQGSVYHTEADTDPIIAIMRLQGALRQHAPNFGRFVRRVHVFRMEEWSDVTALLSTAPIAPAAGPPNAVDEAEAAEELVNG